MIKLKTQYKIRVVYKSGHTEDFWCNSFTIKGVAYSWENSDPSCKPIQLGADEIAAVWQIDYRYRINWETK